MRGSVRLAVAGAGLIGRRHIEHIRATQEAELVGIADPSPASAALAAELGVAWAADLAALLAATRPEGVVVATPNQLHLANGLDCIAAGVPLMVEKPIADSVAAATRLVEAAEAAGVALAVGHHRRHNPMIRKAHEILRSGRLGRIVAVHGICWFFKPDDYFDVAWRRQPGAGPVLVNLIHDVDTLRHLCGPVASVQALQSNAVRGHAVEETAGILMRFTDGAIGTLSVSDTVVAPWSWEMTAGENPVYPRRDESCYLMGGTHGSLTIPALDLWHNPGVRSWWEPIEPERATYAAADPLALQVRQFCRVVRGEEPPLVGGRDGLDTLKVIEAVKQAALTGLAVAID